MKNLEDYKTLKYRMTVEFEPEDSMYFVKFPELPGCIAHGETPEMAVKSAMLVKDEWLATALDAGWDIPEPSIPIDISGRITVRTPKYLHQRLNERAQQEGVSLNQIILSFLAEGLERSKAEEKISNLLTSFDATRVKVEKAIQGRKFQWLRDPYETSPERENWGLQTLHRMGGVCDSEESQNISFATLKNSSK